MRPLLAQRQLALAGVALLAAVVSLAVTARTHPQSRSLPRPVGDYTALAGPMGPGSIGRRTACGVLIQAQTEGVAHPTLPCGARVYVDVGRTHVLTRVIDHGPYVPGRAFDLTPALAQRLGVEGVQTIHWSYARVG